MKAKIGIIGCGQIVKIRHAPELATSEYAEVGGFYDFFPERAKEYADTYGGRAYSDYKEMLSDPSIDGVVICTTNDSHASITIEALNSGKCVLCEKPMATTLEDAEKIIEAEKNSKGFFMAAHNQRFTLGHRKAKELIESGVMGEVLAFRCTLAHPGPERFSVNRSNSTWYLNKTASGLGCISDLGIHKCDVLMYVMDDEIARVGAIAGTRDKRDENGNLAEVYDNAVCIIETKKGTMGTLNLSYTNYSGMENCTVYYCQKGVLRVHVYPDCAVEVVMDGAEKIRYVDVDAPRSHVVDEFAMAICSDMRSPVPAEAAYKALKAVFMIEKAAKQNSVIGISDSLKK